MIVNEKGRFITQRQEAKLAHIEPSLPSSVVSGEEILPPEGMLTLVAPSMPPLHVPLDASAHKDHIPAAVWEWAGEALDCGDAAAAWLSKYLGRTCRLTRFDLGNAKRPTDAMYADGFETAFSDGFPFLVISQESLDKLNEHNRQQQLEELPINRFRPSIYVSGCEPFEEDTWQSFTVGREMERVFKGVKACARCKVTRTNQVTLEVGEEPLKILSTFREGSALGLHQRHKNAVFFGMNVICQVPAGSTEPSVVRVGEKINVLQRAASLATLMPN